MSSETYLQSQKFLRAGVTHFRQFMDSLNQTIPDGKNLIQTINHAHYSIIQKYEHLLISHLCLCHL